MDMTLWMLCGAALGWVSFARFKFSEGRGLFVSLVVGASGALIGGRLLAPLLGVSAAVPGGFSIAALLFALAAAAALLLVGDKVYERFGV
jgi:uncharacterized membrane protein YeaQ/YmgE (transglycosylase-associated protein family)